MNYYHKYLKYKYKYFSLKNKYQYAGEKMATSIGLDIEFGIPKNTITDANNNLTINLYENLEGASNLFSPISITFVLSLLDLAAIGSTDEQLIRFLNYKYSLDDLENLYTMFNNNIMKINIMFIINNKKINNEYLNMIKKMVFIINENLDDTTLISEKINYYIKKKTGGIIKNIIKPLDIDNNISFILVNAIYFKASWQYKFNINNTTKMKFHKTINNVVDMMHQNNYFNYYENDTIQIVELPYNDNNYVMGIILPKKYLTETDLEYDINNIPNFTVSEINEFINNIQLKKIDLYIPKFIHRKNIQLVPIMKKMGIIDLFSSQNAQLDLMAKNIHVSKIIHEVVVIVDEAGTDSATIALPLKEEKSTLFKADHVFIYYIRYVPNNIFMFFGDYQGD